MKNKSLISSIALLLAALFWGCAFVAQDIGANYVKPFTFNAIRMFLGGLILFVVILIFDAFKYKKAVKIGDLSSISQLGVKGFFNKKVILTGVICGSVLAVASTIQQFGLHYTTAGKAGFITTLYIVLVPLFGLFVKKSPKWNVWISVALAIVGLYLLCVTESFSINFGDLLVFICAFCFAAHIIVIDKFANQLDSLKVSCVQFLTTGTICFILMFIFETPKIEDILKCVLPILYMAIFSTSIAYTLQVVAQKNVESTVASLLMSFESVFAALAAWVIQGDVLSIPEFIGCVFMFFAIVLAQLKFNKKKS